MSEAQAAAVPEQVEKEAKSENPSEPVTEPTNVGETSKQNEEGVIKNSEEKANGAENESKWEDAKSVYDFTVKDIDGNEVSLAKYKGHPLIVVNVASNCGFTKTNYNQLNELYDKYESGGLRIAAFPCSQFLNQEPGCDIDIKEFAKKNSVRFDMYAKIPAVNGQEAVPLYRWLKNKQKGIFGTTSIKWNFTKFLVNKEGEPVKRFAPTTSPNSIESDIKALLA